MLALITAGAPRAGGADVAPTIGGAGLALELSGVTEIGNDRRQLLLELVMQNRLGRLHVPS